MSATRPRRDAGFDPKNIRSYGFWVSQWWMPWLTFAASNGGGMVSPDGKKLMMDDPATIDAIQKMADLINVQHVSPTPTSQQNMPGDDRELHSQRAVAMAMDGTWDLLTMGTTKEQQGLDYGIGVLPIHEEAGNHIGGNAHRGLPTTKNPTSHSRYLGLPYGSGQLSVHASRAGSGCRTRDSGTRTRTCSQKWIGNPRHPPEYKTAVVDFAINYSQQLPLYYCPTFAKMDDVIEPALAPVWLGQKTASDAIKNDILPKITPIFQGQ